MPDEYWKCDICKKEYERDYSQYSGRLRSSFPSWGPNVFEEHPEKFCFKCYTDGIMWAMKQANRG